MYSYQTNITYLAVIFIIESIVIQTILLNYTNNLIELLKLVYQLTIYVRVKCVNKITSMLQLSLKFNLINQFGSNRHLITLNVQIRTKINFSTKFNIQVPYHS